MDKILEFYFLENKKLFEERLLNVQKSKLILQTEIIKLIEKNIDRLSLSLENENKKFFNNRANKILDISGLNDAKKNEVKEKLDRDMVLWSKSTDNILEEYQNQLKNYKNKFI